MAKISEKIKEVVGGVDNISKFQKFNKRKASYIEYDKFADSNLHEGYFCYNCIYFVKPNHCVIVTDEGQDVDGNVSNIIAPYGICSLWTPNEKEIK